jgi:hypothetical protein
MEPAFYGWRHPKKGLSEGRRQRIMWRDFSKAFRGLLQIRGYGAGSYRPDLHYMRGPGPKWHAKYGSLVTKTSQTASPSRRVLSDIAEHRA